MEKEDRGGPDRSGSSGKHPIKRRLDVVVVVMVVCADVHYWVLVQWTRCLQLLLKVLNTMLAPFIKAKF